MRIVKHQIFISSGTNIDKTLLFVKLEQISAVLPTMVKYVLKTHFQNIF